jgi:uncharacterized LabA/DUF88 family protein
VRPPWVITEGVSFFMKKVVIFIDGGFLRIRARKAGKTYNPDFIEQFALSCRTADEEILRILYYDCAPFSGTVKLPVSGASHKLSGSDKWLEELAAKDLFAVRRGILKFRGFKPKKILTPVATITDADFIPDFEQKGVDMRIGLDIAIHSANHTVDRIVLVSNDTDCVPAVKHGRKAGLQVVLIELSNNKSALELIMHSDFRRPVAFP